MDQALKKKIMGALAAGVAAFMFGGSQIMDLEDRLSALEEIHPELEQAALDEIAEELKEEDPQPVEEEVSDEDQIEAEEAEAEAQPLIEADE